MIVAISGVDGSGKTTLAKKTVGELRKSGKKSKYFYVGDYVFLKFVIRLLHYLYSFFELKKSSGSRESTNPFLGKKEKHPLLKLWVFLTAFDNYFNYWRLSLFSFFGYIVICDRYFYDRLVGLEYHGYSSSLFSRIYVKLTPKPDYLFILDVSPTVSLNRETGLKHSLGFYQDLRRSYGKITVLLKATTINTEKNCQKKSSKLLINQLQSQGFKQNQGFFLLPLTIFGVFFLLAFGKIIFSTDLIGFSWDWNYPLNHQQALERLERVFFAWNSRTSLGMPFIYTSSSLSIAVLLIGLSFLPAFLAQRIFIFLIFSLAFWGAYSLGCFLKFNRRVSTFVALAYAFSPVMYSRLVAGHIDMIIGIALIPATVRLFLLVLKAPKVKEVIFLIILLSVVTSHFLVIFNLGQFILIGFLVSAIFSKSFFRQLRTMAVVFIGYVLLNFYWLFPFITSLTSGELYYKGLSRVADEVNYRWQQFLHSPMTLIDVLSLKAPMGMSTEYIFPEPESIITLKAAFYLILLIFSLRYLWRHKTRLHFIFLISCFWGAVLVLGPKTPLGIYFYQFLVKISPPVFFLFANTNRFNIFFIFSGIFLVGFALNYLLKSKSPGKQILVLFFWLLVSTFPFWTGKITQPVIFGSQPLSLVTKKFSSQDQGVYQEINNGGEKSRVTLIPSGQRTYLPDASYSFPWSIWYLKKDEFYGHDAAGGNFGRFVYANLYYPEIRTKNLSKLLGLATVDKVAFYDQVHYLYHSFGYWQQPPGYHETLFDPGDQLKINLSKQEGLIPGNQIGDKLTFYENSYYRPRITLSQKAYLASGDFEILESLFSSQLPELPVIFARQVLEENLPPQNLVVLLNQSSNWNDLMFLFLKDDEIVYPGQLVKGFYTDWTQGTHYWDRNYSMAASIDKELIAVSRESSDFTFLPTVTEDPYLILLRGLKNDRAGRITITIDNQAEEFNFNSKSELGFVWESFDIDDWADSQVIKISSLDGENYLGPIVVLSKKRFEEINQELDRLFLDREWAILLEAERMTDEKLPTADDSSAAGQAMKGGFFFNLTSPQSGDFQLSLRLRSNCLGETTVVVKNLTNLFQAGKKLDCNPDYTWLNLGQFKLKKGFNQLEIRADPKTLIDQIVVRSGDSSGLNGWQPIDFERQNRSRYLIKNASLTDGYFINFAENFSPKWKLGTGEEKVKPIKSDGFGNLYFIDKTKEIDEELVLEYSDQKYLNIGLRVSFVSLIILFGVLGRSVYKNFKDENN